MGTLKRILAALGIARAAPTAGRVPSARTSAPAPAPTAAPQASGIKRRLSLHDHALAGYDEEGGGIRALYFVGTDGGILAVTRGSWSPFGRTPKRTALREGALRTVDDLFAMAPLRFDALAASVAEGRRRRPEAAAPRPRPTVGVEEDDDSFAQRILLWSLVQDFGHAPAPSWSDDPTNASARAGLADLGIAVQPGDGGSDAPSLPTLALDPTGGDGSGTQAADGPAPIAPAGDLPVLAGSDAPAQDWSPSGGAYDR